jgi:hypothetical protein
VDVSPSAKQRPINKLMAERVGFEPTLEFPLNTLSKRAPSATRPSLRRDNGLRHISPRKKSYACALGIVTRFEQFIKHRQYLLNVSANTIRWYRHAFKWLPPENPTHEDLNATVLRMRESGLRPTGCNAAARAINAYKRLSSLVK